MTVDQALFEFDEKTNNEIASNDHHNVNHPGIQVVTMADASAQVTEWTTNKTDLRACSNCERASLGD